MAQQSCDIHGFHNFALFRLAETNLYYFHDVLLFHKTLVHLLQAGHLVVVEPIGCLLLTQLIEHLGIELLVVNLACVVDELPLRNLQTDIATIARSICQGMRIVGGSHKRGIARSVFLRGTIDGSSIYLAFRKRLLQRGMLTGADSLQLIQTYQQIVGQRHLLVKLVRQVQVVQEILAQMLGQQSFKEGGLAAALISNERRHYFVAVKSVHLKPMGHSRTEPDAKISQLLGSDSRQSFKEFRHMVLSVPLWQRVQVVANGVIRAYLFRINKLHDVTLRIMPLADILALGTMDNAVLGLLGQRTEIRQLTVRRLCGELHLTVQLVATEAVVLG